MHKFAGGSLRIEKGKRTPLFDKETETRLKSAVTIEAEIIHSPKSEDALTLRATVHNERAGHNVPTGMPGIREVWLGVTILDRKGDVVYQQGKISADGELDDNTRLLGYQGIDKYGAKTSFPWAITNLISSNTSIPPKGSSVFDFEFYPKGADIWPLRAIIILHYRSIPPSLLKGLLPDEQFDIPVIDMAKKQINIPGPGL